MSDSESENNNNSNNVKYNNLRLILDDDNLEKLYEKSEEDIISF